MFQVHSQPTTLSNYPCCQFSSTNDSSMTQHTYPKACIVLIQVLGWENIELISDRPLETMLDEFKRLKNEFPDRCVCNRCRSAELSFSTPWLFCREAQVVQRCSSHQACTHDAATCGTHRTTCSVKLDKMHFCLQTLNAYVGFWVEL